MSELKNELGHNKTGSLLSIRSKLYFVTEHDELIKCAKHGFRQPSKQVYEKMLEKKGRTSIRYSLNRMIKLKESYRRHCLPRRMINQTFTISLKDDGKRVYDEPLETVGELLSDSTYSEPLQNWNFEVQP